MCRALYIQSVHAYKDILYPGLRPHSFAPDEDSQTLALPTSLFFSHCRPSGRRCACILQDFGEEDASCLSQKDCEKLLNVDDKISLEIGLKILVPGKAWTM